MEGRSVADVEGPWVESHFNSSLIERCRKNWSIPVGKLSNYALATFLRQKIALDIVIPEGQRRLQTNFVDDTELYDDELSYEVQEALKSRPNTSLERTRER
jgi:hypothetical protein